MKRKISIIFPIVAAAILFAAWLVLRETAPIQRPPVDSASTSRPVPTTKFAEAAVQTPSVAAGIGVASSQAIGLSAPKIAGTSDTTGSLNDRVGLALSKRDGVAAAKLAAQLHDCNLNDKVLEVESSKGADPHASPEIQAVRMARIQGYQRQIAACQTVPGDWAQVRRQLLDLAVEQGVPGAAGDSFSAGSRQPATLSRLAVDADSGDLQALSILSTYENGLLGISRQQQDAARYALKLVAADPEMGRRPAIHLAIAESYATAGAKFDFSNVSEASRTKGEEIAQRLKVRLSMNDRP